MQTTLDVAGIADPTGAADLVNATIYAGRGQWRNAGISTLGILPFGDVAKIGRLGAKAAKAVKGVSNIAKNAKKMSLDDIGDFLNAGKDWHGGMAKKKYLKKFEKELKGDTNVYFYLDKNTKQVFLKSNKSGNWINTGQKFN